MPLELDTRQRAMLREMGVSVWLPTPQPPRAVAPIAAPEPARAQASRVSASAASIPAAPTVTRLVLPTSNWPALVQAASDCQACALHLGRKHSTLSSIEVPIQADWLVLGDPPDGEEDSAGQPFVGQAGILLDNMLAAVGASRNGQGRAGAYVCNVVKCRPPSGHVVQREELQQCVQYLQAEIAMVQPKVILGMGRLAVQLLNSNGGQHASLPLDKQRGTVYRYGDIPVVLTYHPHTLLRSPANKAKAWADLCLAMDAIDQPTRSL